VLVVLAAPTASAHPLGNLSVNTYDGVVVAPDGVRVDHVEDIAEVPAVAALRAADTDVDGATSPTELDAWAGSRCAAAASRIRLAADGTPLDLSVRTASATTAVGQAGLTTVRVQCDLGADLGVTARTAVTVDVAPPTDLGWREITAAGDGTTVVSADVPSASVSARLTSYPGDLTTSPDERTATATVEPGGPRLAATAESGPLGAVTRGVDGVTTAVEGLATASGPFALVLLVLGGLVLGAMHALAPGHGKTVVAMAALAGQGTRRRELARAAATLGASITLAHTGSVVLVGVALTALGAIVPAALFPALAVVAGMIVVAVGIGLLRGRAGAHVHGPGGHTHDDHTHDGHDHGHDDHRHDHDLDHDHGHGHGHDRGHDHGHDAPLSPSPAPRQEAALSTTTALAVTGTAPVVTARVHDHDRAPDHDHAHGDRPEHDPGTRRRTLVALGAVGGLTPSPTALVVLLGTLAVGRPVAGLLAVLAFGIGMAVTLVGAGLLAVVLGRRAADLAVAHGLPLRWLALVPRLAGAAVVCAGVFLALRGVLDLVG
jgi:ABC-type nickel/cobalt efflux system permease component RcnA